MEYRIAVTSRLAACESFSDSTGRHSPLNDSERSFGITESKERTGIDRVDSLGSHTSSTRFGFIIVLVVAVNAFSSISRIERREFSRSLELVESSGCPVRE